MAKKKSAIIEYSAQTSFMSTTLEAHLWADEVSELGSVKLEVRTEQLRHEPTTLIQSQLQSAANSLLSPVALAHDMLYGEDYTSLTSAMAIVDRARLRFC